MSTTHDTLISNTSDELNTQARAKWLSRAKDNRYTNSDGNSSGSQYLHTNILYAETADKGKGLHLWLASRMDICIFTYKPGLGEALANAINDVLRDYEAKSEAPAPEVLLAEAIDDEIPF
jgi:hypothetical protein